MTHRDDRTPGRIRLDDERRAEMLRAVKTFHRDLFDEDLSDFRAARVLKFFLEELGPAAYNQAIQDAAAWLRERVADLEAVLYAKESADTEE